MSIGELRSPPSLVAGALLFGLCAGCGPSPSPSGAAEKPAEGEAPARSEELAAGSTPAAGDTPRSSASGGEKTPEASPSAGDGAADDPPSREGKRLSGYAKILRIGVATAFEGASVLLESISAGEDGAQVAALKIDGVAQEARRGECFDAAPHTCGIHRTETRRWCVASFTFKGVAISPEGHGV